MPRAKGKKQALWPWLATIIVVVIIVVVLVLTLR